MTGFPNPSSGLLSELDLYQHETYHSIDLPEEPVARNVNVSNSFALVRAVVELRVLQTTTAILRITRTNPVSISDPNSTICRAIDRREQRIATIVDSMAKDDFEETLRAIAPQVQVPAQVLRRRDLSPSELLEALSDAEEASHGDQRSLRLSSAVSSASTPKRNTLVSEDAAPVVDGNVRTGQEDTFGDERKRVPSGLSSSIPTPTSGSVYSSLGRSLSVGNMNSVVSVPRQCKVVSAAQYTRIVSEREPQFSIASDPYSIDSLVAECSRVDRSAIEINTHRQMKSADSFPGEFPISEGLEYSSLASAKHHSRIPSIRTSVRPFSDL
ncbi:hypothetical protein BJX76DRAFT_352830 [Aspergillus varians]